MWTTPRAKCLPDPQQQQQHIVSSETKNRFSTRGPFREYLKTVGTTGTYLMQLPIL